MPFLRVLRDKRGYETTYLMHWFRDGNRQRSKILYVFRTPPGVKVGRDAIDPEVIREIEAQYPEIEFDWRALRENQQVIDTAPEPRRPRRSRKDEKDRETAGKPAAERAKTETSPAAVRAAGGESAPLPRLVIPSAIEGTSREEQLVFLLKWYLNLRERVPHRTQDPIRREALRALVERLNPEVWVGEDAIVAGLKDAAEALHRLSTLFAKRRKRQRRARSERTETVAESESSAPDVQMSEAPAADAAQDTRAPESDSAE